MSLACCRRMAPQLRGAALDHAAISGTTWLMDRQADDGGWPAYPCARNIGHSEPSFPDLTANALRALAAWRDIWFSERLSRYPARELQVRDARISNAIERGFVYLKSRQRADGSFTCFWFGNEHHKDRQNPVIGTSLVLRMYAALNRLESDVARRAAAWLSSAQHASGGWGPPRVPLDYSGAYDAPGLRNWRENESLAAHSSVEETALAVSALLPLAETDQDAAEAVSAGLTWLINAVEQDKHRQPAILGYYAGKFWYHERLYPLLFATGALSRAARHLLPAQPSDASATKAAL
jgi:squalene-hopene/tetraprenyl-beta-curcumene cyclase